MERIYGPAPRLTSTLPAHRPAPPSAGACLTWYGASLATSAPSSKGTKGAA